MAAGGRQSKLDGWQHQAARLARRHTAVPALPKIATAQTARQQPQKPALRSAPQNRPQARPSGQSRRDQTAKAAGESFSREETLDWILKARKQAVAIRADKYRAAEVRIAELEASLEAAFERVTFLGDENQSLQTSLEMSVSENLALSKRLAESESRTDEARAELNSSAVVQVERDMAASAAERRVALLESLAEVKETRIHKLEQARNQLEQDAARLLETVKARDKALGEAEQKILGLTALFEKIELRLDAPRTLQDAPKQQKSNPVAVAKSRVTPAPRKIDQPANADTPVPEIRLWRRQLDTDDWLLDGPVRQ